MKKWLIILSVFFFACSSQRYATSAITDVEQIVELQMQDLAAMDQVMHTCRQWLKLLRIEMIPSLNGTWKLHIFYMPQAEDKYDHFIEQVKEMPRVIITKE